MELRHLREELDVLDKALDGREAFFETVDGKVFRVNRLEEKELHWVPNEDSPRDIRTGEKFIGEVVLAEKPESRPMPNALVLKGSFSYIEDERAGTI